MKRKPDFQIPGYLNRWHLIPRNKWFNIYLHQIIGPDPAPDWHDHPWWSMAIKLRGNYYEIDQASLGQNLLCSWRKRIVIRDPAALHRIYGVLLPGCWTLFITGPVVRDWGFWVGGKWIKHTEYTNQSGAPVPKIKMSANTKAVMLAAHIVHAGRFTGGWK